MKSPLSFFKFHEHPINPRFFVSSVQLIDDVPWFSHWNASFPSDLPRISHALRAAPPPLSTAEAAEADPDPWAKRRLTSSWYSCGSVFHVANPWHCWGLPRWKNDGNPSCFPSWLLWKTCLRLAMHRGGEIEKDYFNTIIRYITDSYNIPHVHIFIQLPI